MTMTEAEREKRDYQRAEREADRVAESVAAELVDVLAGKYFFDHCMQELAPFDDDTVKRLEEARECGCDNCNCPDCTHVAEMDALEPGTVADWINERLEEVLCLPGLALGASMFRLGADEGRELWVDGQTGSVIYAVRSVCLVQATEPVEGLREALLEQY